MFALLVFAVTIDPLFYQATKVWVEPMDSLASADRPVATCLAEHLPAQLPLTLAATKDEADLVFKVQGNLPSATARAVVGILGGSPSAHLNVERADGRPLWDDGAKLRRTMMSRESSGGRLLSSDGDLTVYCGLADELLDTLRSAMKKARDGAKR